MSLGKLIGATVLDLVLVMLIGFVGVLVYAGTVAPTPRVGLARVAQALGLAPSNGDSSASTRWRYYLSLNGTAAPADDRALEDWLRDLPGVHAVEVRRGSLTGQAQGETHSVTAQFLGPEGMGKPDVPWEKLGYQAGKPSPWLWWTRMSPALGFNPTDDQLVLLCLGGLQA